MSPEDLPEAQCLYDSPYAKLRAKSVAQGTHPECGCPKCSEPAPGPGQPEGDYLAGISRLTIYNLQGSKPGDLVISHSHQAGVYRGWILTPEGRSIVSTEFRFHTANEAEIHMTKVVAAARAYVEPPAPPTPGETPETDALFDRFLSRLVDHHKGRIYDDDLLAEVKLMRAGCYQIERRAEAAEAERDGLRVALATLLSDWTDTAKSYRKFAKTQSISRLTADFAATATHYADTFDACIRELAAAAALAPASETTTAES